MNSTTQFHCWCQKKETEFIKVTIFPANTSFEKINSTELILTTLNKISDSNS